MNFRLAMLSCKSIWVSAVFGLSFMAPFSRADEAGQKAVAETLRALRKEGFKTVLADFNLAISPEMRARETILMEAVADPPPTVTNEDVPGRSRYGGRQTTLPTVDLWDVRPPELLETVESNSAAVVWQMPSPEKSLQSGSGARPLYSWDDFRKAMDAKGPRLDRAAGAIFTGPLRFDLSRRKRPGHPFPPTLNQSIGLIRLFDNRLVLALHDGNLTAGWTNLLAATLLVTACEPGPPQKCHLARFENTEQVFEATWQALQKNGWSEARNGNPLTFLPVFRKRPPISAPATRTQMNGDGSGQGRIHRLVNSWHGRFGSQFCCGKG